MSLNATTFKKTFSLFIPYILKSPNSRKRLGFAIVFILIDVMVSSLVPYFSKQVVDSLSMSIMSSVSVTVLLLGFFWILEKTIGHIQEIIFFPVINNTIRNMAFDAIQHIHTIALSDYHKLSVPETMHCIRWRISISARSFIRVLFLMIIPSSIKLLVALVVAMNMGAFGIVLLPTLILSALVLYKGTHWYVRAREEAWHIADTVTMRMNDSILNTKTTRFFHTFEMQQVGELLNTEATLWHKHNTRLHSIHIMIGGLFGLATTFILFSAIVAIQNHTLTVGDFVLLKGQLIAAFLPLKLLAIEFRQMAESLIDIKKIIKLFEIPTANRKGKEVENKKVDLHSVSIQITTPAINIKKITFYHDKENILFENLSFQIASGEKLAIIGDNGSGKSTLINLMASLYSPKKGSIDIYGQNINHFEKSELSKHIQCIPQDFRLFNTRLRDNIAYGITGVSEEDLIHVSKQVGLMDLIYQMPQGFDTIVGEMGSILSGGEKQKVALARALLLAPQILLLDEATNSLPAENETTLLKTLFSVIPTVIVATHRKSTLHCVDRILKIQAGNLKTVDIQGTRDPLTKMNTHSKIGTEIYV